MKNAWIENGFIKDICLGVPVDTYHPDIAAYYDTLVPDDAQNGDAWDGATLTKPVVIDVPVVAVVKPPIVSVIEYKMLFTSLERIAIKNSTNAVIQDLQELMNDPRVTKVDLSLQSISNALDYMTQLNLIALGRKAEILTGVVI